MISKAKYTQLVQYTKELRRQTENSELLEFVHNFLLLRCEKDDLCLFKNWCVESIEFIEGGIIVKINEGGFGQTWEKIPSKFLWSDNWKADLISDIQNRNNKICKAL